MSLVEVLVAMSILSLGVLGFVGSFQFITKSIRISRARTIATNLAQEKMENLKNEPYYKLALTTTTLTNNDFSPPVYYDDINYGMETIVVGGISFKRAVLVTMAQETNGLITSVGFNYPDTGLKSITVFVMWQQDGVWKKISLDGIYENPVVDPLSGQIIGRARYGGAAVAGALIRVVENADWSDTADVNGSYGISAQPGNYSLRASSAGYYDSLITNVDISSTSALTVNFTMTQIGSGTVTGNVWINPYLVVSQVMASTTTKIGNGASQDVEFIQLFNPTTYTWNIGSISGSPDVALNFYDEDGGGDNKSDDDFNFTYVTTFVPAGKFYLYANATYFWLEDVWINADAYYTGNYMTDHEAGSVRIVRASGNTILDTVGWNDEDDTAPFYEGSPIPDSDQDGGEPALCSMDGMAAGWSIVRISSPASVNDEFGPAYDSGNNSEDFLGPHQGCEVLPSAENLGHVRNTTDTRKSIIAGVPAIGANVTADDLLAPSTVAYSLTMTTSAFGLFTLSHPVAKFVLNGVSTGTWNIIIGSGSYSETVSSVTVTQGVSTGIINGVTSPSTTLNGYWNVFLDTQSAIGYISGLVTNVAGNPLPGIQVYAAGTTKTTGINGRYFVTSATGSVYVIANPNNDNSQYVSSIESVNVQTGVVVTKNFTLTQGGVIQGFISTDGSSILPNVQVVATIDGAQYGLATSDDSGNFYIKNLSTGTYDVAPVLDPMETYSPLSISTFVTPGTTVSVGTFTISGAQGELLGSITFNGLPATSGALILVSTGAISSTPPQIVASSSPAQAPIYAASSLADGTYLVEVRGSTSTTYRVSVYIPTATGSGVTVTTKTYSGISITPNGETTLHMVIP